MTAFFNWISNLQNKFQSGGQQTLQKYSDNPAVILDDTVTLLSNIKNSGADRMKRFVDEFNAALPIAEEAGFELQGVELRLGIPPKLVPHFNQVKELTMDERNQLMSSISDKRYTRLLLSTLFKSTEIQSSLKIGNLPKGTIQIELTAVPNIILEYGET